MCGICGKLNFDSSRPVSPALIDAMTDVMEHRGPDDRGTFIGKGVGLGHRRLSIIDLSPLGHQPMTNEDGSISVVFNGEIYNYLELREELLKLGHTFRSATDTEVIVHAYEEYGREFATRFNGMFAIGIWDGRKKELVLVRDRLGVKPLYYHKNGQSISFASEIKSLLTDPDIARRVDLQALSNFFTLHYVPGPRTMFAGIMKLQPGHMMTVKAGKVETERYWELRKDPSLVKCMLKASEEDAASHLYSALNESVRKRMQSDVPVGALLSGGLDSSAILGLMTELSGAPVPAFTVGYSETGEDSISEFKYSRQVARHFQSQYKEVVVTASKFLEFLPKAVWHQDEPIGEPASIPLYFVSKLAKDNGVTVLLTGEGSDELFAGYNRHWGEILSGYYQLMPAVLRDTVLKKLIYMLPRTALLKKGHRSMSIGAFNNRYMSWHTVYTEELKNSIFKARWEKVDTFSDVFEKYLAKVDSLENLDKILYLDLNVWLPDDLLMKKDKMGMATSIEARVPFLDYTFVELAFQIPAAMKVRKLVTKYILKRAMERLLPKEIIYRKKEGFPTPIANWLRTELKDFTMETLCSSGALSHGFFDRKAVRALVDAHMRGTQDNNRLLFPLINFEIWHKLFFSNERMETVNMNWTAGVA